MNPKDIVDRMGKVWGQIAPSLAAIPAARLRSSATTDNLTHSPQLMLVSGLKQSRITPYGWRRSAPIGDAPDGHSLEAHHNCSNNFFRRLTLMRRIRRMARLNIIRFGFGALLFSCIAASAQAGFVSGFVGNSETYLFTLFPTTVGGSDLLDGVGDGVINFAVYETETGDWLSELGVEANPMVITDIGGSAGDPDSDAAYVYFYQMVNSNPAAGEERLTDLFIQRGLFDQGGYITVSGVPAVFDETVGGATGGWANPSIGTAAPAPTAGVVNAGDPDTNPENGIPGFGAGSVEGFVGDSTAAVPTSLNRSASFYNFEWVGAGIPVPTATVLSHSVVVYLTSSRPPAYLLGRTQDGQYADGDVPSNVPELGTFAMSFGALAMGLIAAFGTSPRKPR